MSRTAEVTYELEFYDTLDGSEHVLKVELEVESGQDSETWGSTYVKRPWRSVVGEQWFLDGRQMARWCIDHYLRWHGYLGNAQRQLMERARDKALEQE
jgi:hypothetical protein